MIKNQYVLVAWPMSYIPSFSQLQNALVLNRRLNMQKSCLRKRIKNQGISDVIAYGFLPLSFKYELRKYYHYTIDKLVSVGFWYVLLLMLK